MSSSAPENHHGHGGALPPARFNMAHYCLAASAARLPDKIGLVVVADADAPLEKAERWSYGALDEAVRRVGAGLLAEGLQPGERLMIRMPNTSDYALLFFGAIAAGLVPLPSSAQLTTAEADFLLADSNAAAVAVAGGMTVEAGTARVLDEAAVARLRTHAPLTGYADTGAGDPAFLVYTSGTSGRPKGVLHAQRSAWGRRPMYQGWYGIGESDVVLHAVPSIGPIRSARGSPTLGRTGRRPCFITGRRMYMSGRDCWSGRARPFLPPCRRSIARSLNIAIPPCMICRLCVTG